MGPFGKGFADDSWSQRACFAQKWLHALRLHGGCCQLPCAILLTVILVSLATQAAAQGTAFNYQGVLTDNGVPAHGFYDLTFSLSSSSNFLVQVGATLTNLSVPVSNGLFNLNLDFGSGVFMGNSMWLQIGVRTNGTGPFTPLGPLQPIEPAPYAITAGSASNLIGKLDATQISGTVSTAQLPGTILTNGETLVTLSGTFSGDGGALTNYQATRLVYSVSTNPPVSNGTNYSLDFAYNKVIWILTNNAFISNTLNAASGDNHLEVWIKSTGTFTLSWLPTVNLIGMFTTNGLQITNSQGYWVMAVSQYGTNWNTNTCTYAIVPPNR